MYSSPQKMNETSLPNYAHITWDHFGNKLHIHLSRSEMLEGKDIIELLYEKAQTLLPEFRGILACEDELGHEVILNNDGQMRLLLSKRDNRIKVHTTLSGNTPSHLAASDFFEGSTIGDEEPRTKENDKKKVLHSGKIKTQISMSFPIFIRGSWIGPNKFIGGGYWGGVGPIPSNRYWQTAAGGRPPW